MINLSENNMFYARIIDLLQTASNNIVRAVNHTMILTYFEIGKITKEEEHKGKTEQNTGKNF